MVSQQITDNGDSTSAASAADNLSARKTMLEQTIRRLEKRSNQGFYILSVFIILSIGALHDFSFLPPFPTGFRKLLGAAPPAQLISVALLVYVFSAVIHTLSRMMEGSGKTGGMAHLGYLGGFYLFFHFSGDMQVHFWAVFAAGFTILGLESYQLWNYCRDEIQKERDVLAELEGLLKLRDYSP